MREAKFQGTAGYVTRMSGGVGGRGREASSYPDFLTGIPALVTATGSQCGATLGLVLPTLLLWPTHAPSLQAWLAVIVLGVLCTGSAYILYFRLIANAGPARALTVTFLIPVFAVLYGVAFLGESVTLWMLLCAVVIICGTALASGLVSGGLAGRVTPPESRQPQG